MNIIDKIHLAIRIWINKRAAREYKRVYKKVLKELDRKENLRKVVTY